MSFAIAGMVCMICSSGDARNLALDLSGAGAARRLAAQRGANGYSVWESYVAGLVPTNPSSRFNAVITIENGVPSVKWTPELPSGQAALRRYTVYGKKSLSSSAWTVVPSGREGDYNFFKVTVEMQ